MFNLYHLFEVKFFTPIEVSEFEPTNVTIYLDTMRQLLFIYFWIFIISLDR
jgi:hypothetical protein